MIMSKDILFLHPLVNPNCFCKYQLTWWYSALKLSMLTIITNDAVQYIHWWALLIRSINYSKSTIALVQLELLMKEITCSLLVLYLWRFKGILSTSCVIFSYPKLLSISVLIFIKWRLTPSYAAKDTIFWQKRPKTIVIGIIVRMTRM